METRVDEEIEARFRKFKDEATRFSKEISSMVSTDDISPEQASKVNLFLAKTVFSKWSIEILTVLYSVRNSSFGNVKKSVRGITSRVLSEKLKNLENAKLVQRSVMNTRPPTVRYSLTEKGLTVAKLDEPVFLYAAITEGLFSKPQLLIEKQNW